MTENSYTVYAHISPTNKLYFGITCKKPEYRWNSGKGYTQNKHFASAINLYGWDSFKHEVIYDGLTKEEACKAEIRLIEKFNTTNSKYGYNRSFGGEHSTPTEETKKLISESKKGMSPPNKSKPMSEEQKQKMKEIWKNKTEEERLIASKNMSDAHIGKKLTKEHKENIGKANVGDKNYFYDKHFTGSSHPKSKKVICLTTGEIFDCIREAERKYGIANISITNCCKGYKHHKSAGKHPNTGEKMVWKYYDENYTEERGGYVN